MFAREELLDQTVFDVNGRRVGRVTVARGDDGAFGFDVALARGIRRRLAWPSPTATFSADDVLATDFGVTLRDEAWRLLAGAPEPSRAA